MLAKPPRDEPDQRSIMVRLVANFPSSSFAFVMATGIISIAAALLDFGRIASLLLAVNSTAFFVLWILTFLRLIYFPLTVIADLRDPRRGPGFLTAVAGTNVLGDQISLLTSHQDIAAALWLGGCALWVGLTYCVFSALATRATKPSITAGLDGSSLLIVVAPQSSAILGAQIAGVFSSPQIVIFASLSLYLLGGAFYVVIITLILYRWIFEPMTPEQLTPSYWINMGAAAITTLAGARLSSAVVFAPVLAVARGYIIGETLLFLVGCKLVDSVIGWAYGVEAPHPPFPTVLPIRLLVAGISAWHVRGGDFDLCADDRRRIPDSCCALLLLGGNRRLVPHGFRDDAAPRRGRSDFDRRPG